MTSSTFSRRAWLRMAGSSVAGLTLASSLNLRAASPAQPGLAGVSPLKLPVRINYNENPFGASPAAQSAIDARQRDIPRYPEEEMYELVTSLAKKESVSEEHLFVTAGSGDILTAAGIHVGLAKGEVLTADPAYLDVITAAENFGGHAVKVPVNARLEYDLEQMESKITERTRLVYICNPSNPTGTVVPSAQLREFCKRVSEKVPVFIDEAYLDLADDYAGSTLVSLVREGHNVIVTRTFSKIYALAGERVGYGVMQPAMATQLRRYNTGAALSILGVVAATASLRDPEHVPAMHAKIKAGRDAFIKVVAGLGKKYAEAQGNFVFFKTGMPIKLFAEKMRAEGVIVGRPFPPLLDWARISIGLPEEMAVCHAALQKVLG